MESNKVNLLDFTPRELQKFFLALGEKSFHATQVIKWIHQLGVLDLAKMTNLSLSLRQYLVTHTATILPEIVQEQIALDGTRKWRIKLIDSYHIETVFIPTGKRGTLCLSSQVGCSLGCVFCATGRQGFKRNLTVAEIIGQLWLALRRLTREQTTRAHLITNVVFMGMGEPLLNYRNVLKSIELLLDDNAYGLSKYRITISSCGLVPEIRKLRQQSEVALAISLHAPTDSLRNKLMPINKKYCLRELITLCNNYFLDPRRQVTIAYIMLANINDGAKQAHQLVKLLAHGNYKINLIPGNRVEGSAYSPASQEAIAIFRNILLKAGLPTLIRRSRGAEIMAACGQLVGKIA